MKLSISFFLKAGQWLLSIDHSDLIASEDFSSPEGRGLCYAAKAFRHADIKEKSQHISISQFHVISIFIFIGCLETEWAIKTLMA